TRIEKNPSKSDHGINDKKSKSKSVDLSKKWNIRDFIDSEAEEDRDCIDDSRLKSKKRFDDNNDGDEDEIGPNDYDYEDSFINDGSTSEDNFEVSFIDDRSSSYEDYSDEDEDEEIEKDEDE